MPKKKIKAPLIPRWAKCVWCEKQFDLNGFDYVVDGGGKLLHDKCFHQRWKLNYGKN